MSLEKANPAAARPVALWLLACCAMVFAMVAIGGATRLTGSGLSIVEWKPLTGWLPPFTDAGWQALFDKYRQFPQYLKENAGMSIDAFRSIFWLEYIHRLWGRVIGIVFLVPFLWFLWKGMLPRRLTPHLAGLFVLGGLQGALGWIMVQSGLIDRPDVSPYRLTAHLSLAIIIYVYMLWLALGLLRPPAEPDDTSARLRPGAIAVVTLVGLTVLAGGFVAGIDAGFDYNTFPLMDGRLVPSAWGRLDPWWLSLFEDVATVQFNHRLLATLTLLGSAALWLRSMTAEAPDPVQVSSLALLAAVVVQYGLGIATLLLVVPVPLGVLHQAWAMVVVSAATWTLFELRGAGRAEAAEPAPSPNPRPARQT